MPDAASPIERVAAHDAWLWLSTAGDAVLAAGFLALACVLLRALQQRADLPRLSMLTLAACLSLLSLTHGIALWDLWDAQPWLLVAAKQAAAAATTLGVICSWRQLPQLLSLPTRAEVAQSQADSKAESEAVEASSHAELESFMSTVSHDLRSPLTTIAGQAGLLELSLGAQANEDTKRRVQRIHHSVRHMSQIIEALLTLSRIARQELRPQPLDLTALAHQTIDALRRKEPQRTVNVEIQPELRATGDPRMVADLLGHLLGNAWKFTARTEHARIEVGTTQHDGVAALFVRDNGAGFDMAYASKLFKPFQRLHPPSEFEGAGIGLASAARLVARHGGKIWVEAAPKAGAVFYFTLAA